MCRDAQITQQTLYLKAKNHTVPYLCRDIPIDIGIPANVPVAIGSALSGVG
jgi:hypothetical protein